MKKIFVLFALLSLSMSASAEFTDDLFAKFPQVSGATVKKSFGNFYSVVKGNRIMYVNEDLTILIKGDVIDLKANKSLTNELLEANRPRLKVSDLNIKDAIQIGSGADKIYVFSDPDCPYCRQLEQEFDKLHGVTVYVFPFPIDGLHPNATAMAENIWCAKDRSSAWHNYVGKGIKPLAATCDNPVQRNIALAEKYQFEGTPEIVFEDGTIIPGAVTAEKIQSQILMTKKK